MLGPDGTVIGSVSLTIHPPRTAHRRPHLAASVRRAAQEATLAHQDPALSRRLPDPALFDNAPVIAPGAGEDQPSTTTPVSEPFSSRLLHVKRPGRGWW
ncbi:hypothetical protein E4K10_47055 [Streptomyces sp. T1317-0309]|nr:hypothetical protein E4K10_47055 [Streptomyces sp. T1317-0309]